MFFNKKIRIYFLYISLLFLGLYFNINPSGGAKQDYQLFQEVIKNFSVSINFEYAEFFFKSYHHSPVFYIFMALLQKIFNNFEILKITNNDDFGNEANVYFRNKDLSKFDFSYRNVK